MKTTIKITKRDMKKIFKKPCLYADTNSWPDWSVMDGEVMEKSNGKWVLLKE